MPPQLKKNNIYSKQNFYALCIVNAIAMIEPYSSHIAKKIALIEIAGKYYSGH